MVIVISLKAKAQEESKQMIEYDFHPKIDTILSLVMNQSIIKDISKLDSLDYYLTLYLKDTVFYLVLDYDCFKCSYIDSTGKIKSWIKFLIHNTNRFTKVLGKKVPIILESDLDFGVLEVLDEGTFARTISSPLWEFRRRFTMVIDNRRFLNYKIYEMGFD